MIAFHGNKRVFHLHYKHTLRFKDAQDSIPSGWEVMGMNFVDGLLKVKPPKPLLSDIGLIIVENITHDVKL